MYQPQPPLPRRFTGTVLPGKQLGRTMGFPTANLIPGTVPDLPRGVYVCTLTVDGKCCPAVTNLGKHPTLPDGPATLETNILLPGSFELYGKEITVELLEFLRPEQRFPDVAALMDEVHRNIRQAKDYFEKHPIEE